MRPPPRVSSWVCNFPHFGSTTLDLFDLLLHGGIYLCSSFLNPQFFFKFTKTSKAGKSLMGKILLSDVEDPGILDLKNKLQTLIGILKVIVTFLLLLVVSCIKEL